MGAPLPDLAVEQKLRAQLDKFSMPEPNSGCLLWLGATNNRGYGKFRLGGAMFSAHRASWLVHRGPIADGLYVCHTCDVPGCVNPDHLWLGNAAENNADMARKGRHVPPRGERNGRAKLTDDAASKIFADPRPYRLIADDYGIALCTVSHIKTGARRGRR